MQFSQNINIRCINVSRETINAVLIGEEEFNLKVGGMLIARSATYGSPSGIERVEAGGTEIEITALRDDTVTNQKLLWNKSSTTYGDDASF
jgi:hypothetical protein